MARIYAGILGLLALQTSLALGIFHGEAINTILFGAWLSLMGFAAVGYVAGALAGWIVQESVQTSISAELDAEYAPEGTGALPTA